MKNKIFLSVLGIVVMITNLLVIVPVFSKYNNEVETVSSVSSSNVSEYNTIDVKTDEKYRKLGYFDEDVLSNFNIDILSNKKEVSENEKRKAEHKATATSNTSTVSNSKTNDNTNVNIQQNGGYYLEDVGWFASEQDAINYCEQLWGISIGGGGGEVTGTYHPTIHF